MQNNSGIKNFFNTLTTIIVAIVVVFAVFLMGARLIGLRVFNVVSGSMEPAYSVGDLIYVKSFSTDEVKVGDVITFILNEQGDIATHRVIRVDKENQHFYTKGDANASSDSEPVHFKNYIGKPVFVIPLLGHVSKFIQEPPGMYYAIAFGVLLVVLVFLPDVIFKEKKKDGQTAATVGVDLHNEALDATEKNDIADKE